MNIKKCVNTLIAHNIVFYTGVPDSQLKALCDFLSNSKDNIIAANEGNATAIAAGYHMATGKTPCVYLQNSGLGNITNPTVSLLNRKVYAIPALFVIGWRGEPGVDDEPQHIFQGAKTLEHLNTLDIEYFIIDKTTTEYELERILCKFDKLFAVGKQAAIVVRKGALTNDENVVYKNANTIKREDVIREITAAVGSDIIISTTGKTSRELFEIREANHQSHKYDFLTVGSMGHSSSIALGIALYKPNTKVWCIDGDGAVLMHMGSMAIIGSKKPNNLIHLVINNSAHESVGGMPTAAGDINLVHIAKACGYCNAVSVDNLNDFSSVLDDLKKKDVLSFIEVKCAIGSRDDLGRPTTTPVENKTALMDYLEEIE